MPFTDGTVLTAAQLTALETAAAAADAKATANGTTALLTKTLSLPATAGSVASTTLLTPSPKHLLCLQVKSTVTAGAAQNYTLEIFDGVPGSGGVVVYQATGITFATYTDNAMFYIPPAVNTALHLRLTNIDALAITATVTVRALALA